VSVNGWSTPRAFPATSIHHGWGERLGLFLVFLVAIGGSMIWDHYRPRLERALGTMVIVGCIVWERYSARLERWLQSL
jgi:hypothetical protein